MKKQQQQKKKPSQSETRYVFSNSLRRRKLQQKSRTFREQLQEQLRASRFRYLNEQFYVSSSTDAKDYFSKNVHEFKAYHDGYEQQAALWPKNPLNEIVKDVKQRLLKGAAGQVIADFGCGQAKLAQSLEGINGCKIFSFDLVAVNKYVTACDMAHTNLYSNSVNIAVFCLSLMGSDLSQYIKEANRVLKDGGDGLLKIAEIKSRFSNSSCDKFIQDVEKFGFTLVKKDLSDSAFYFLDFRKKSSISKQLKKKKKLPQIELKSCLYKQR